MTLNISFDPKYKLIRIRPFYMTLTDATKGNNYVTVDSIDPNMPQSGWLALAKSKAKIVGTNDMSAGYDFSTDPRNFLIISGDGIEYETIVLDQYCATAQDIADLINSQLQQTMYATAVEAVVIDGQFICLQQKDPYWGESFSFVLDYGSPDALTILGIPAGTQVGLSDVYSYTSWSGNTIYIEGTLTRDYPTGVYCAAYYSTIQVQDLYNDTMDWVDNPEGISHPVPMEASGYYPLGGGAYTDKIFVLVNGWQILPHQGNYILTFIGTLITDDGRPRIRLPRTGVVSVIFQVGSQGIVAETVRETVAGEILNRETTAKTGSTIAIWFRSKGNIGATCKIYVYDPNGNLVLSGSDMTNLSGTDLYKYNLTFNTAWGTGDFLIKCRDVDNDLEDSITITVLSAGEWYATSRELKTHDQKITALTI